MKIGFDAKRIFQNATGLGNYSRTLVRNLNKFHRQYDLHLFTPKVKDNEWAADFQRKYTTHTATFKPATLWRTFRMTKDIDRNEIDIYHGLTHELPFGIHRSKVKSIVTVHDLIFKIYPHQYKPIDRKIYDWKLKYACKAADKILAISEHTKRDIIKYYGTSPDKIEVIHQSCSDDFFNKKSETEIQEISKNHQLPKEYLLYVGSIIERKNLLTLVKSLPLLEHKMPLVVIGGGKEYKNLVLKYIQENQLQKQVIFLKNVANEDLPAIYQKAKVFVYPSLYEGFGIPIIEAIFSQTPVVTTRESALPEAAGEFSYYIKGTDANELAQTINGILNNKTETEERITKSLKYAEQHFLPVVTAQKLHQLYLSV
ncbi:MAG: glycosyltransferase family 4 protein [Saprospiraceae bacterium]